MRRYRNASICVQIWQHRHATLYCFLTATFIVFLLLVFSVVYYDPCGARRVTKHLCDQYEAGVAAGSLCYKLCLERTVYLSSCHRQADGLLVFAFQKLWLKVPEYLSIDGMENFVSHYPADGTTVEHFRARIAAFLSAKLGRGQHYNLIEDLFTFADFDQNQQISLAEARSIWQLLQNHDFLMLFVFRKSTEHFLKVSHTCGGLYAVEQVPNTYLYQKQDTFFQRLFPMSYLWMLPKWKYRANIAVGLLDFVFTVYEHDDVFYNLCDINPQNLGYTSQYEFRFLDFSSVVSDSWLKLKIRNSSCSTDEDCVLSPQCTTICDHVTWQCSNRLRRPNLSTVCSIIRDYIYYDSPASMRLILKRELSKCEQLDNRIPGTHMQHMVSLNNLYSMIFDEIKFDQDKLLR